MKVLSGKAPVTIKNMELVDGVYGVPEQPDHFTSREKRAWDAAVRVLEPLKILRPTDGYVLGALCTACVRWKDAEKEIQRASSLKAGLCLTTAKGKITGISPLVNISRQAQQDMVYYAAQLGMTPASRIKMVSSLIPPARENPFLKIKENHDKGLDADRKGLCQIVEAKIK
jgi:P27 family predicted phage terminase small subunit